MSVLFLLKLLHIACALTSYILFVLRSYWRYIRSDRLQQGWIKKVPHFVDSTLLISALLMAWGIGQYPFVNSWLTIKTIALVLYIVFGLFTLRFAKEKWQILLASIISQLIFFYIVCVAIYHQL